MDRSKILCIIKHLGAACREWRKTQTNMTSEDMGNKLGVTQTTISAFENGHTNNLYIFMGYVNEGFDPMESEEVWQALNTY